MSVIVIVFNRREFILEAVNSVLCQDIPKGSVEIIVSKNYSDENIDLFLNEKGVINIVDFVNGIGPRLANCIRISKGSVISFLEDDDTWESNKLTVALREFEKDQNLGYYHNSYTSMNDLSVTTKEWIHHKNIRNRKKISLTPDLTCELSYIMRYSPNFNLSSITISKNLALEILTDLTSLSYAVDVFLFFKSLSKGYTNMLDSSKLTKYRIHQSSMNKAGTFLEFKTHSLSVYEDHYRSISSIFDSITNHEIREFILSYHKEWSVRISILKGNTNRIILARELFSNVHLFFLRKDYSKYIYFLGWLALFFPRVTQHAYYFYLKNALERYNSRKRNR